jgi:hypothetical protein
MSRLTVPLAIVLAACAGPQPAPRTAPPPGEAMQTQISVALTSEKPGRPPLTRLRVDVELRNDADEARWVLIPANLGAGSGGVDTLEQLGASVGRLLGGGGCWAVRLAPGARLALRNLEVRWWRHNDDPPPPLEVRVAADVRAGGEPLAAWFSGDPTVTGAAEVDLDATPHVASHHAPGGREVPLAAPDAESVSFTLPAR